MWKSQHPTRVVDNNLTGTWGGGVPSVCTCLACGWVAPVCHNGFRQLDKKSGMESHDETLNYQFFLCNFMLGRDEEGICICGVNSLLLRTSIV